MSNAICPKCGAPLAPESSFCASCEARIETPEPPRPVPVPRQPRGRLSKRAIIGIAAAFAVVITGVILVVIFLGGGGNQRNSRVILSLFGLFGVPCLAAIILRIFLHRREKDSDFVLPGIIPALARRLSRKQKNDDD